MSSKNALQSWACKYTRLLRATRHHAVVMATPIAYLHDITTVSTSTDIKLVPCSDTVQYLQTVLATATFGGFDWLFCFAGSPGQDV